MLRRRLQPSIHTRVSAICMFHSGIELTPTDGLAMIHRARLLLNPHATFELPAWASQVLGRFPEWTAASAARQSR